MVLFENSLGKSKQVDIGTLSCKGIQCRVDTAIEGKYSAWTKQEDAVLLYNRSLDPPISFAVISTKLRERTRKACCSRYNLLKKKAAVDAARTGMGIGTN